ncbi:MAG: hypothetical protein WD669_06325 [Pirellulales bacterium]
MASLSVRRRDVSRVTCWLPALIALLAVPARVAAIDKRWDGGAAPAGLDGTFSVGANWNTVTAPNFTDVAHFGTSAGTFQNSYTVSFTTNPTNQALVVEDDNVTFDLNGHLYTLTATNPITLGVSSVFTTLPGQLTIREGFVIVPSESLIKIGASLRGFLTVATGGIVGGLPHPNMRSQINDLAFSTARPMLAKANTAMYLPQLCLPIYEAAVDHAGGSCNLLRAWVDSRSTQGWMVISCKVM